MPDGPARRTLVAVGHDDQIDAILWEENSRGAKRLSEFMELRDLTITLDQLETLGAELRAGDWIVTLPPTATGTVEAIMHHAHQVADDLGVTFDETNLIDVYRNVP